ncbi:MAG: DUF4191 domain-containing protein [Actinomycetaceae bacterium]|nr:DUF4191 domain-containing protein [Actinomycetaceae bacterium]
MSKESSKKTGNKQGWFANLKSIYKVAQLAYPWVGWAIAGIMLVTLAVFIGVAVAVHSGVFSWIIWIMFGVTLGMLFATLLLTRLATKSMYSQLDGKRGAVHAILGQVKKGWIVEQEPVAMNRKQDIVYRLVGRPGIVLISEGPSSRVTKMLSEEERKCKRVAQRTPIHRIQVGNGSGQVALPKLMKTLNKLPKQISKHEVPVIFQRLSSIQAKAMGLPKGIDPAKARINRRMLRGK